MAPLTEQACPNCATASAPHAEQCGACGIRLTGPQAIRLRQVTGQIALLQREATSLVVQLRQPVPHRDPLDRPTPAAAGPRRPVAAPGSPNAGNPTPLPAGPRFTGQQLLLGLGALLLLSATSAFLVMVWLVVGILGQAAIALTLTALAVTGAAAAARRGLTAAAETGAVLAVGLWLMIASFARDTGLAGLDQVRDDWYWLAVSPLTGLLLLGFDRLMPRSRTDRVVRPVRTFRPAAAVAFALTPWWTLVIVEPTGATLPAMLAGFAALHAGSALVAARYDSHRLSRLTLVDPSTRPTADASVAPAATWPAVSTMVLAAAAAVAFTGYLTSSLLLGYDLTAPTGDRYTAAALLAILPLTAATATLPHWVRATTGTGWRHTLTRHRDRVPAATLLLAAPVLGIPALDAPVPVLAAIAAALGVAVTLDHLRLWRTRTPLAAAWLDSLIVAALVTQPALFAAVWVTTTSRVDTLAGLNQPGTAPLTSAASAHADLLLVLTAAAWAIPAVLAAVRTRTAGWALWAQCAVAAVVIAALRATTAGTATPLALLLLVAVETALAAYAVRRIHAAATTDTEAATGPRPGSRPGTRPRNTPGNRDRLTWSAIDTTAVLFATGYALLAAVIAVFEDWQLGAVTIIATGVLALVYAASPHRLAFGYLGSLAVSIGTSMLLADAGYSQVEAHTAPLVLLLTALGYLQHRRNHTAPTRLTMGPALAVGFTPVLAAALLNGDELRLTAVTLAALVVLAIGFLRRWAAPVKIGALVLALVALTQGGPLIAYVPGWVLLGTAGTLLLTAGVAWEKAVVTGRRAGAWLNTLT